MRSPIPTAALAIDPIFPRAAACAPHIRPMGVIQHSRVEDAFRDFRI